MSEEEIGKRDLGHVDAEFVNVSQSTIRSVEGGHVQLQQVGALSIDGERVEMTQSASCVSRASHIEANQSMCGVVVSDSSDIQSSLVPGVFNTGTTEVRNSLSVAIAANRLNAEDTKTILLIARQIEGNVQTLFDWKSVLSLGAIMGGVFGLLSLLRRK